MKPQVQNCFNSTLFYFFQNFQKNANDLAGLLNLQAGNACEKGTWIFMFKYNLSFDSFSYNFHIWNATLINYFVQAK